MKKTLIALAALAATGAFAQSSVTLFGIADAAYTSAKTGSSKLNSLSGSGSQASSRVGLRGEEDLGGGMKAGFHLEAGVNVDNGSGQATNTNNQTTGNTIVDSKGVALLDTTATPGKNYALNGTQGLTFNRRSTVSVMGGFGEVRLGRDYTTTFWSQTAFDPFGTVGVGASMANAGANPSSNPLGVRVSNSIAYLSPKVAGFALWAQTYFGENKTDTASPTPGDKKTGGGNGLRVTYDNGPISLALASSQSDTGIGTKLKASNIAGSYDLGVAKLVAVSSVDKNTNQADIKGYLVGATAPVGPGTVKFSISESKQGAVKSDKTAVGYVYPLSKRTSLYTTYASVKNEGGAKIALGGTTATTNVKSTGFDLGVTHSF